MIRTAVLLSLIVPCSSASTGGSTSSLEPEPGQSQTWMASEQELREPVSVGTRNPAAKYRGHVLSGPEMFAFLPCSSGHSSWLVASGQTNNLKYLRTKPRPGHPSALYVELDGTESASGHFGHLGLYGKELSASAIFYVSRTDPSDCRFSEQR